MKKVMNKKFGVTTIIILIVAVLVLVYFVLKSQGLSIGFSEKDSAPGTTVGTTKNTAKNPGTKTQTTSPKITKPPVVTTNPTPTGTATYKLTVNKSGIGSGTVVSGDQNSDLGQGITCGTQCTETIISGTSVVLGAYADSNSIFTSWGGGGCSGTGTCTVVMNSNKTVTAMFDTSQSHQTSTVTKSDWGISFVKTGDWQQTTNNDNTVVLTNTVGGTATISMHYSSGNSVTDTAPDGRWVTYSYDIANNQWMMTDNVSNSERLPSTNPQPVNASAWTTGGGLPVFGGVTQFTVIVPVSHTTFITLTMAGPNVHNMQELVDLLKTLKKI